MYTVLVRVMILKSLNIHLIIEKPIQCRYETFSIEMKLIFDFIGICDQSTAPMTFGILHFL